MLLSDSAQPRLRRRSDATLDTGVAGHVANRLTQAAARLSRARAGVEVRSFARSAQYAERRTQDLQGPAPMRPPATPWEPYADDREVHSQDTRRLHSGVRYQQSKVPWIFLGLSSICRQR